MKPADIVAILSFRARIKIKTVLATVIAVLTSVCSYGQGTVGFANNAASLVWIDVVPGDPQWPNDPRAVETGTRYSVELMWAPGNTPDASFAAVARRNGNPVNIGGALGTSRGIFSGGLRTIQEIAPGAQAKFQVRVWETAAGASYAEAVASGDSRYRAGVSGILLMYTGGVPSPVVSPPSLTGAGLTHFAVTPAVTPIPEPSAIALGLLGVGALLMLRRHK